MAALTESELPQTGRVLRWRLASDEALARAAAAGAEGAFDEIFTRYQPALVRHCRAVLLDADEAQDAAQNALASALRALRRGTSEPVSLKAWLYRIAHNEAITLARRRSEQRARRAPGEGAELLAVAGPADDETRERLQELVVDLRELPDRQRNALLLRELSGLGYDEVAEALGTSAGAARQTVFEARAALMDIGAGRSDDCGGIQRILSDGDGRVRRGRRVRSHLRGCGGCTAFAAQIDARERDLALAFPMGPVLAFLTSGAGAGAASIAGAGAVAGGGWSLGLGAAAIKCASLCAAAAVIGTVAMDSGPVADATHLKTHRAPLKIAAAKSSGAHRAAIVLPPAPAAGRRDAIHATERAAEKNHTVAASSMVVAHTRVVQSPHRSVAAHLPAATAVPHNSQASTGDLATTSVPAAKSAVPATATIPSIAQHAVAAAQQIAGSAVQQAMKLAQTGLQQGLALAQQMMARATSGFFGQDASSSANAPASSTSP